MPPEAKVFYTEDDRDFSESVRMLVEQEGHIVVFEARDLESALAGAERLNELKADVAVLDGNLKQGDKSCSDGRQIASVLRKANPNIKIIAFSGEKNADYGDVFVSKEFPGMMDLPKVITDL